MRVSWVVASSLALGAAGSARAQPLGDWMDGPPLLAPRADHALAIGGGGELVAIGGEDASGVLASVEVLEPGARAWRVGPALPIASRVAGAAAVTLRDGRVLLVGGRRPDVLDAADRVSAAGVSALELASATWTAAAPMSTGRMRHTATLLADGRVLVVGGLRRSRTGTQPITEAPLASAEIFDPSSGLWSAAGALAGPRVDHAATLLPDGRVLVVGADDGAGGFVAASDLFDPATGQWTRLSGPLFSVPRATLLLDGTVIALPASGSLRRFDPVANTWGGAAGTLDVRGGAAALLGGGALVLAGGRTPAGVEVGASLFTPPSTVAPLGTAFRTRDRAAAVRMPSGAVWVVGGSRGASYLGDVQIVAPEPALDASAAAVATLPRPRFLDRAAQLPDGRWLLVGSEGTSALHDPVTNRWTEPGAAGAAGSALVTLAGGKVLSVGVGGVNLGVAPSTQVSLFDPATSSWTAQTPLSVPRGSASATRLADGRVLVVGGALGQTQAEIFDPEAEAWRLVPGPAVPVEGHAAALMPDGAVVVSGGWAVAGPEQSVSRFDPATETWSSLPPLPERRAYHAMVVLPSGDLMVAGGVTTGSAPIAATWVRPAAGGAWVAGPTLPYEPVVGELFVLPTGDVLWRGGETQRADTRPGAVWTPGQAAWRALAALTALEPRATAAAGVRTTSDVWSAGGYSWRGSSLASGFTLRFGPAATALPSFTLPARIPAGAPLLVTGARLIPPTAGASGRPSGAASDVAHARLFSLDGRETWRLRPRAASASSFTVDVPAVPPGYYALYVASLGGWTGAITRVGNRAPVASARSFTTPEDTPIDLRLVAGDRDGDTLAFRITRAPTHGALAGPSAAPNYTPAADFAGSDTFAFRASDGIADSNEAQVSITVTPINDAPIARDDGYTLDEDVPLSMNAALGLLANDTDVDSPTLTVVAGSVSAPAHGSLVVQPSGAFEYRPALDYAGVDQFSYLVTDGSATSAVPALVTLTVRAVNDAPVAAPDRYGTDEDTPLRVTAATSVLGNDTDVEQSRLTARLLRAPRHGTLALDPDGAFRYAPARDFSGEDDFAYEASDGAATSSAAVVLEVRPINDAPIAVGESYDVSAEAGLTVTASVGVLTNDGDVDGDRLSALLVAPPREGVLQLELDGSLRYDPRPGFEGIDDFAYQAFDGLARSAPVTVRLDVRAGRPLGQADTYAAREDTLLALDRFAGVLANDDGRGRPLVATLESQPTKGRVSLREDGSFDYQPHPDVSGPDEFRYRASNGLFTTEPVLVHIDLAAVNDPPTEPAPLEPLDGARVPAGAITFGWQASTDVDDATIIYTLDIADSAGIPVRSLFTTATFLTVSGPDALPAGRFSWQLTAVDGRSASSHPSAPRALTVLGADGELPDGEGGASGCGCAAAPASRGTPWPLWASIAALWAYARRRT